MLSTFSRIIVLTGVLLTTLVSSASAEPQLTLKGAPHIYGNPWPGQHLVVSHNWNWNGARLPKYEAYWDGCDPQPDGSCLVTSSHLGNKISVRVRVTVQAGYWEWDTRGDEAPADNTVVAKSAPNLSTPTFNGPWDRAHQPAGGYVPFSISAGTSQYLDSENCKPRTDTYANPSGSRTVRITTDWSIDPSSGLGGNGVVGGWAKCNRTLTTSASGAPNFTVSASSVAIQLQNVHDGPFFYASQVAGVPVVKAAQTWGTRTVRVYSNSSNFLDRCYRYTLYVDSQSRVYCNNTVTGFWDLWPEAPTSTLVSTPTSTATKPKAKPVRVRCVSDTYSAYKRYVAKAKPRRCTLGQRGWTSHSDGFVGLSSLHWKRWGKSAATATGVWRENQGAKAWVKLRLYRLRTVGQYRVYTRAEVRVTRTKPRAWHPKRVIQLKLP